LCNTGVAAQDLSISVSDACKAFHTDTENTLKWAAVQRDWGILLRGQTWMCRFIFHAEGTGCLAVLWRGSRCPLLQRDLSVSHRSYLSLAFTPAWCSLTAQKAHRKACAGHCITTWYSHFTSLCIFNVSCTLPSK